MQQWWEPFPVCHGGDNYRVDPGRVPRLRALRVQVDHPIVGIVRVGADADARAVVARRCPNLLSTTVSSVVKLNRVPDRSLGVPTAAAARCASSMIGTLRGGLALARESISA